MLRLFDIVGPMLNLRDGDGDREREIWFGTKNAHICWIDNCNVDMVSL